MNTQSFGMGKGALNILSEIEELPQGPPEVPISEAILDNDLLEGMRSKLAPHKTFLESINFKTPFVMALFKYIGLCTDEPDKWNEKVNKCAKLLIDLHGGVFEYLENNGCMTTSKIITSIFISITKSKPGCGCPVEKLKDALRSGSSTYELGRGISRMFKRRTDTTTTNEGGNADSYTTKMEIQFNRWAKEMHLPDEFCTLFKSDEIQELVNDPSLVRTVCSTNMYKQFSNCFNIGTFFKTYGTADLYASYVSKAIGGSVTNSTNNNTEKVMEKCLNVSTDRPVIFRVVEKKQKNFVFSVVGDAASDKIVEHSASIFTLEGKPLEFFSGALKVCRPKEIKIEDFSYKSITGFDHEDYTITAFTEWAIFKMPPSQNITITFNNYTGRLYPSGRWITLTSRMVEDFRAYNQDESTTDVPPDFYN